MSKSLIDWFKISAVDNGMLNDLSDGVAMARELNRLDSEYFTGKFILSLDAMVISNS